MKLLKANICYDKQRKKNTKVFVMFLALLFICQSVIGQTNLVQNGNFEDGTSSWSSWGGDFSISNDANNGSSAAFLANRSETWHAIVQDIAGVVNGEKYTIEGWMKILGSTKNLRATLKVESSDAINYMNFFRTDDPEEGEYIFYTDSKVISWTGDLVGITLYFETDSDVDGVYPDYLVDDVNMFEVGPVVLETPDGSRHKDIKNTMLVGGFISGAETFFNSDNMKEIVLRESNTSTLPCYPAWGRWDNAEKYKYTLDPFTAQVKEMKDNDIEVVAHMLLGWNKYFPEWFYTSDFSADTVESLMNHWIKTIITHKGNDTLVDVWNLVNEAFSWNDAAYWSTESEEYASELHKIGFEDDASGLSGDLKVHSEHPVYIRKAFELARQYTDKKLELRDFPIEFPGDSKYNAFYQLVVHLLNMNTPLDAVGFQTHLDLGKSYDWEGYTNNIKRYRDLGLEVYITEVDVGDTEKDWNDDKAIMQKAEYYKLVCAAIKGGASQFHTWGYQDENDGGWRAGESPLIYTADLKAKPAYYGMQEAFIDMSHLLYWDMNNVENSIISDVMLYGNNGLLKNFDTNETQEGFVGNAIYFDGVDDYIVSSVLSENILNDFTLSFYIKTNASENSIIAELSNESTNGIKFGLSNGKAYIGADGLGADGNLSSNTQINDGNWHYVVLQRKGSEYSILIDDLSEIVSVQGMVSEINSFALGGSKDGSLNFNGLIDEVKIYDQALENNSLKRCATPFPPIAEELKKRSTYLELIWFDESSNEEGFIVEKKAEGDDWEQIAAVGRNITVYKDYEFESSTKYYYRVKSYNNFGESVYSRVFEIVSPVIESISANLGQSSLNLNCYPSPVDDELNVNFNISVKAFVSLEIISLTGKKIHQISKSFTPGDHTLKWENINGLTSGIYVLKLNTKTGAQFEYATRKIIVL